MFGRHKSRYKTNKITGRQQERRKTNWVTGQSKVYAEDQPRQRGFFGTYVDVAIKPGILPRIKRLGRHFGHFAYLLALIYQTVRLIPANHPILNPNNIGTFGFRDVFGVASDNLKLKRENLDQILMYFAVMIGFAMIIIQFVIVIGYAGLSGFNTQANAQGAGGGGTTTASECAAPSDPGLTGMFSTPCPSTDLAYQLLRNVFGTNVFGEPASASAYGDAYNTSNAAALRVEKNLIVEALQQMLGFFSSAMLVIAILIILYYVFSVVGEAAISGTPFGQRFDGFWAPLRIVFALGMLVPIAGGYNAAQFATLYIAKTGSGLATNAWVAFYNMAGPKNGGTNTTNVVVPIPDANTDVRSLFEGIILSEVCAESWKRNNGDEPVDPYITYRYSYYRPEQWRTNYSIPGGTVTTTTTSNFITMGDGTINSATQTSQNNPLGFKIIWKTNGIGNTGINKRSVCGEITVPRINASLISSGSSLTSEESSALTTLNAEYMRITRDMISHIRETYPEQIIENEDLDALKTTRDNNIMLFHERFASAAETARASFDEEVKQATSEDTHTRGWAAAGLYYNKISRRNGQFYDAVTRGMPIISSPPHEIRRIQEDCQRQEAQGDQCDLNARQRNMRTDIESSSNWFNDAAVHASIQQIKTSNPSFVESVLATIFGLNPLFDFVDRVPSDPMSELAVIGRSITNHSLGAFSYAIGLYGASFLTGIFGAFGSIAGTMVSGVAGALAGLLFFIGAVGLSVGFILFYVLPLLPFMYFFFAVGSWLAEIFEAIVAMPLFALAHIRIDGGGLPGQAASSGYYLLFAIFIRPILIVLGMIAGILIFSATAIGLHVLFDDALQMLSVHNTRAGIDTLAYSIIYTVLIYNLGMTSFKLIDKIPEGIMRWMGNGTPSFSDGREDPMGNQQQLAVAAAGVVGTQLGGQMSSATSSMQQGIHQGVAQGQRRKDMAQNKQAEDYENELKAIKSDRTNVEAGGELAQGAAGNLANKQKRYAQNAQAAGGANSNKTHTDENGVTLSGREWGVLAKEAAETSQSATHDSLRKGIIPSKTDESGTPTGEPFWGVDSEGNDIQEPTESHKNAWKEGRQQRNEDSSDEAWERFAAGNEESPSPNNNKDDGGTRT